MESEEMNTLKGYLLVRGPEDVGQVHGDTLKNLRVDGKRRTYRGMDREPWWTLDELMSKGSLSDDLKRWRSEVETAGNIHFSPGVCVDRSQAMAIRSACAQCGAGDEMIWIESLGTGPEHDGRLLGYELYIDGYGSLLRLGMFTSPEVFRDFHDALNEDGLFSSLGELRDYGQAYLVRSRDANLEPIESKQMGNEAIFRVYGVDGVD